MLIFSSLTTDYNYFNHSCYQSGISVHICQQLLCNESELSYYIKTESCQGRAACCDFYQIDSEITMDALWSPSSLPLCMIAIAPFAEESYLSRRQI